MLDALNSYAQAGRHRYHMPGHKGHMPHPFDAAARIDFTELDGTGNLYTEENGAIRHSEALMAKVYGAEDCLYLTGGATQGIFAMLAAVTKSGERVAIDRACHKSIFHAMAMLDLQPVYITRKRLYPFGINTPVDSEIPDGVSCALITSPTYYGVLSRVQSAKCPILYDAAHGAHLRFTNGVMPDADISVISAHKTLNALGQAAFLLCKAEYSQRLRHFTSVFGTSSPSYPILASLDQAQADLTASGQEAWGAVARFADGLRAKYPNLLNGDIFPIDKGRLCLFTGNGYRDALRFEREFNVTAEMADELNVVFILSPNDTRESMAALERAIASVKTELPKPKILAPLPLPEQVCSPRNALFSRSVEVSLEDSEGRIAARPLAPYPPGVPVVAPGEKIDKKYIEILKNLCYNNSADVLED